MIYEYNICINKTKSHEVPTIGLSFSYSYIYIYIMLMFSNLGTNNIYYILFRYMREAMWLKSLEFRETM